MGSAFVTLGFHLSWALFGGSVPVICFTLLNF